MMIDFVKYIYSKVLRKIWIPSLRNVLSGKHVKIGSGSNLINVSIGDYSYTGSFCSFNNVEIGKFCSIASYCSIGGDKHDMNSFSTSPIFEKESFNLSKNNKVIIGNDVWIGEKVFIMSGIQIGDGAVIGAHAVVTKDVKPYEIVVGVPAKHLKYRFNDPQIVELLKLKWWNLDYKDIKKISNNFENIDDFIQEIEDVINHG